MEVRVTQQTSLGATTSVTRLVRLIDLDFEVVMRSMDATINQLIDAKEEAR